MFVAEIWEVILICTIYVTVYVNMGTGASDTTTLDFSFSGTYDRKYEVKVTQLPCSHEYR